MATEFRKNAKVLASQSVAKEDICGSLVLTQSFETAQVYVRIRGQGRKRNKTIILRFSF